MDKQPKRIWQLRIAAMLVGLLPLVACELILRALEIPALPPAIDPYLDLHNLKPLFELHEDGETMQIGAERMHLFSPAEFQSAKPADTFRVFALGGSTTFGEPYSSETAFPKWLELNLQAAVPEKRIEVINCGGLSYASYRVLAIVREVLQYDADLIVVYTGQNEYLERRSYEGFQSPNLLQFGRGWLSNLRTVQLIRLAIAGKESSSRVSVATRTEMQAEVDALLDYQGGLAEYHRDDAWREPVVDHFRWNIDQMCDACRDAGVPLVLVKPVTNLLDCPPMKIESSLQLTSAVKEKFDELWERGRTAENASAVVKILEEARSLDPEHAGINYLLGKLAYANGDYEQAKSFLIQAKDNDVCPLRATTAIQQELVECSQENDVPLVDAESRFSELSDHGIVGNRWLVDHIHPSIEGHQRLGEWIAQRVLDAGWLVAANANWSDARKTLYDEHLATLSEAYYHRGKQRLEGLLLWTQGRAKKLRDDE